MTFSAQPNSTSLRTLIAERQAALNITDEALAKELGFDRSAGLTMIKQGAMRMPTSKIATLAKSLALDPAQVLRLALSETAPEVLAAVDALLIPPALTANELKLLEAYRCLSKGQDVTPIIMDGSNIVALIAT